ncbi:MAG: DUF2325 domain-containing protein [Desulfobacteraceae bacterium]|nr:DUF2325 domain-containing protein [Desulfobacteraceae bacterium]MBC2719996.1 DUF2325 domain-containing protein [Desulfobacteraceae bacterium]
MQVTNVQARNNRRNRKLGPVQKRTLGAEACPLFDFCGKRILIVGGITKIKAFYRRAIEKKGAVFEYHDGWGKHGLEVLVRRSDMVLCPVNCNSHNACLNVKKLCKKYCKRVHMLPSSSLSSISQALSKNTKTN